MNTQTTNVLITGATGAFGKYLLKYFLQKKDLRLFLLVRAGSDIAAQKRVEEHTKIDWRIEVYAADLAKENLGLQKDRYEYLVQNTTHILHAAASTRFNQALEHARKCNVETTNHMLMFAKKCIRLKRFGHLSSALVAGKRLGLILENEFEHDQGFINTYEQSKYEAESFVRIAASKIPTVIFRPPLVISKPHESYQGPVNLLSHSLRLIKQGNLPLLPGTEQSVFDIVDSDATAKAIVDLLLKTKLGYLTYHLSNGERAITAGKMLELLEKHLGTRLNIHFCGSMESFRKKLFWAILFRPWLRIVYKKTESYLPEIAYPKTFDNKNLLEELDVSHFDPPPEDVFRTILE